MGLGSFSESVSAAIPLKNAQLKYVFSGSKISAIGGQCRNLTSGPVKDTAVTDYQFDFRPGGSVSIQMDCDVGAATGESRDGAPWTVLEEGRWEIRSDTICIESAGPVFETTQILDYSCWQVGKSRFGLEVYDSKGERAFRFTDIKHPKHSSRDDLLTALKEIKDSAVSADTDGNVMTKLSKQLEELAKFAQQRQEQEQVLAELLRNRKALENSVKAKSDMNANDLENQKTVLAELTRKRAEQELALVDLQRRRKDLEAAVKAASVPSPIAASEEDIWETTKNSNDIVEVSRFLSRFPDGRYAGQATAKIAVMERFKLVDGIDFGNFHALVIGIDEYKHLQNLGTAVKDAWAVAGVLENDYSFKVSLLENPDRGDILDAFDELRESLTDQDNLLIYYAGHGWQDESTDQGYWLASNAKPNRRHNWVSNSTLTDTMKSLSAKHVMVVADSCFSGTLVRAADVGFQDADYKSGEYWRRMAGKQTRVAMVSGGLEPVADEGGSGHSPFAKAFIDALSENKTVIDGSALFQKLLRPVIVAAQQTPQYSDVRNTGHDGGDFLFVRKR